MRLVDSQQRGGQRGAEERQDLPAVSLRRLRQGVYESGQSEAPSTKMRRVPGVLSGPTGETGEAAASGVLLQSVW